MGIVGNTGRIRAGMGLIFVSLLSLALLWTAAGCGSRQAKPSPGPAQTPDAPGTGEVPVRITLYFSDSQAEKLAPEEREVAGKGEPLGETVVRELIRGPGKKGLLKTIPEGTRLLSFSVADGVARVDFSPEIQTRHWGGSSGEIMTVYSVVNSLAEVKGIDKVQFLVEGKKVETLAGHMDMTRPVGPDRSLIKK